MEIMYSVDWCQFSCVHLGRPGGFLSVGQTISGRRPCGVVPFPKFSVCEALEFNRQFQRAVTLKLRNLAVCHVFFEPRRADQPRERCIFKAANRLLYTAGWADTLLDIIHSCNCYVVSLSRLDICADFNLFADGTHPAEFIRRYLTPPIGGTPSYIRHSSNKFRAFGSKVLHAEGTAAAVELQTLSFGTRESAVQTNLYNKSAELKEHDKPYIRAAWVEAGLNPYDVWRVEFSLNSRGVCVIPQMSDYVRELSPFDLQLQEYVGACFLSFAKSYFSFHVYTESETRKLRSLPFAELFPRDVACVVKPRSINHSRATGRTEKIVARKLRQLARESDFSPAQLQAFSQVCEYVETLSQERACAASMEVGDTTLLSDMAATIKADELRRTDGVGRVPKRRIQRLVSLLMSSPSEDIQAYKEAFTDFLFHAGVFAPESYLERDEREFALPK